MSTVPTLYKFLAADADVCCTCGIHGRTVWRGQLRVFVCPNNPAHGRHVSAAYYRAHQPKPLDLLDGLAGFVSVSLALQAAEERLAALQEAIRHYEHLVGTDEGRFDHAEMCFRTPAGCVCRLDELHALLEDQ